MRGYRFDARKLGRKGSQGRLLETAGQLAYEWAHLKAKLKVRSPERYRLLLRARQPWPHPLFVIPPGNEGSGSQMTQATSANEFAVFICHASEDKAELAEPLAQELRSRGYAVWYDRFVLTIGDSLRRKIEEGLVISRFGVVILL